MKTPLLIFALVYAALLVACGTRTPTNERDIILPDARAVIAGAKFTEATVMGEGAAVRVELRAAVEASIGLPSEAAVRESAAQVEASLAKIEAAIAASPSGELERLDKEFRAAAAQFLRVIEGLRKENARLSDANTRFWNRVLVGLGVACTLGAVASVVFAAQVPLFGPRITLFLGSASATCFLLAYVAGWAAANPVKTSVVVAGLVAVAGGLAYGNYVRDMRRRAPTLF